VRKVDSGWQTYRTRFLIRAKQLTEPLMFVDALGHEHNGHVGDYLVESSDGTCRVAPREIFEDIYVPMGRKPASWPARSDVPVTRMKRRLSLRPQMQA
jgi:hypothetical protein